MIGSTRRLLAAVLGLLVAAPLAWAVLVAVRVYRFESGFYHPPRRKPTRPADLPELRGLRDVTFTAADGTRLAGWYQPPRDPRGAAIIVVHGSGGDRAQLAPQAAVLARHGYGVLLFDWPGHGESGGAVAYGRADLSALRAAVDWLEARAEVTPTRIGGLGCSMGAYLLLCGAAEDPRLRAVVAEGAPTDLDEVASFQYRRSAPVGLWAARLAARHAGVDLGATDARRSVREIRPRALLLVGGSRDDVVPPAMQERLYAAAGQPKELWLVDGAGHCDALTHAPAEYERRVTSFFERELAEEGAPR